MKQRAQPDRSKYKNNLEKRANFQNKTENLEYLLNKEKIFGVNITNNGKTENTNQNKEQDFLNFQNVPNIYKI